jgi:hypothetical protein
LERPGAVKGAPLFGAAKRTLDGEDRSKIIELEGKDRGNCDGSQFDTNVQNIVARYTVSRPRDALQATPICRFSASCPKSAPA